MCQPRPLIDWPKVSGFTTERKVTRRPEERTQAKDRMILTVSKPYINGHSVDHCLFQCD
jgi:hypothetical protein